MPQVVDALTGVVNAAFERLEAWLLSQAESEQIPNTRMKEETPLNRRAFLFSMESGAWGRLRCRRFPQGALDQIVAFGDDSARILIGVIAPTEA